MSSSFHEPKLIAAAVAMPCYAEGCTCDSDCFCTWNGVRLPIWRLPVGGRHVDGRRVGAADTGEGVFQFRGREGALGLQGLVENPVVTCADLRGCAIRAEYASNDWYKQMAEHPLLLAG